MLPNAGLDIDRPPCRRRRSGIWARKLEQVAICDILGPGLIDIADDVALVARVHRLVPVSYPGIEFMPKLVRLTA